jgi:hypothetical protein
VITPHPQARYNLAVRPGVLVLALAACSGSAPPSPATPAPPAPADAAVPIDAAPDAGPSAAVMAAPAWVFQYATPARTETWTLRHADGQAMIEVLSGGRSQVYVGTATEGDTLALAVSTGTAKLALDCKHAKRPLSQKCNDTKAKPVEVLDCYHADFKAPMPFGPFPGVEYVETKGCTGYRLIAPEVR